MAGFLDLSRELRDQIYTYHIAQDGGYVYEPRTRKLRTINGPIDLVLMRSCKQVAHEVRPLMFKLNTITFKTTWVDRETSERAARFQSVLRALHKGSALHLFNLRHSITDDMVSQPESAFPQTSLMFPAIRSPDSTAIRTHHLQYPRGQELLQDWRKWRQAPSMQRSFIKFMLLQKKPRERSWDFGSPG